MEHSKTRMIAEAGVAIAIAQVLSFYYTFSYATRRFH